MQSIFSKDVEDAVYAGLRLRRAARTGMLETNWSDETYRKMSTTITRLRHARQARRRPPGAQALPARRLRLRGLRRGLEHALHHRAAEAGRLLPARRGVLGPDRRLRRARSRPATWPTRTPSRAAYETDRVLEQIAAGQHGAGAEAWRPMATMDRILFGDNQFFGVNHMSEEKARAQLMRFKDDRGDHRGARRRLRRGHQDLHVHDARPHRRDLRPHARRPASATRTSSSIPACPTRTSTPTP